MSTFITLSMAVMGYAGEKGTSSVNAYWDEDDTLTASIRTTDDVYVIEVIPFPSSQTSPHCLALYLQAK